MEHEEKSEMSSSEQNQSRSKLYMRKTYVNEIHRPSQGIPNMHFERSYTQFSMRTLDHNLKPNYTNESVIDMPELELKYKPNDNADILCREPSYTKFKIPYPMICAKRYRDSIRNYEAQLRHEIRQNIDFQSNAADACYFVRCLAITSFWPPLHNMSDVKHTGKNFFRLTDSERWRLQLIMDTNIT